MDFHKIRSKYYVNYAITIIYALKIQYAFVMASTGFYWGRRPIILVEAQGSEAVGRAESGYPFVMVWIYLTIIQICNLYYHFFITKSVTKFVPVFWYRLFNLRICWFYNIKPRKCKTLFMYLHTTNFII